MNQKNKHNSKRYPEIKPFDIFRELAEYGLLNDFIKERFGSQFEIDEDFRNNIFETLYLHSNVVIEDIEKLFLEKLIEEMQFFLEYTKLCRNQEL